jgi:hypothetical protein
MLAASLLGVSVFASPASAQRASDCGQLANAPGTNFSYLDQSGRSDSAAVLTGLVNAAIQNVDADVVANVPVTANASIVCVTDSLNGNHLEILKNINVDVIDNVTVAGVNVPVLNNVNVLSVANQGGLVYVVPQNFAIGRP